MYHFEVIPSIGKSVLLYTPPWSASPFKISYSDSGRTGEPSKITMPGGDFILSTENGQQACLQHQISGCDFTETTETTFRSKSFFAVFANSFDEWTNPSVSLVGALNRYNSSHKCVESNCTFTVQLASDQTSRYGH